MDSGLRRNDEQEEQERDYTRLLPRALRAIRCANVRAGILPAQSGLRCNDEQERAQVSWRGESGTLGHT